MKSMTHQTEFASAVFAPHTPEPGLTGGDVTGGEVGARVVGLVGAEVTGVGPPTQPSSTFPSQLSSIPLQTSVAPGKTFGLLSLQSVPPHPPLELRTLSPSRSQFFWRRRRPLKLASVGERGATSSRRVRRRQGLKSLAMVG